MTEFEIFRAFIKDRFGFTRCDEGISHDGWRWILFDGDEAYTFFSFDKESDLLWDVYPVVPWITLQ